MSSNQTPGLINAEHNSSILPGLKWELGELVIQIQIFIKHVLFPRLSSEFQWQLWQQ